MSVCYLDSLSAEVILKIFSYLDYLDLNRLKQTCRRFNEIITTWDHALLRHIVPIATNQRCEKFLSRCVRKLDPFQQIRISKNWKIGRYGEKSLLFVRKKYIPWLRVSREYVWFSRGKNIHCYERNREDIVKVNKPHYVICGRSEADVVNFQIKNNYLVSGLRDGSMYLKNLQTRKFVFDKSRCHSSDINSVDITNDGRVIVSGCRDNCLSIWKVNYDSEGEKCMDAVLSRMYMNRLLDRVLKVSMIDQGTHLAVGTSGNHNRCALLLLDVEKPEPVYLPFSSETRGSEDWGILDIKWDTPNTLWSCGYDTYLRRWDIRSGKCVQIFPDPHASVLYSLDYDYCNTIVTGTQMYGRVILWDIRQKNSVQLYFMKCCKDLRHPRSSPIYSLAFDSEYLFTATDQNLSVLDFSVYDGNVFDYSDYCT